MEIFLLCLVLFFLIINIFVTVVLMLSFSKMLSLFESFLNNFDFLSKIPKTSRESGLKDLPMNTIGYDVEKIEENN